MMESGVVKIVQKKRDFSNKHWKLCYNNYIENEAKNEVQSRV